MPPCRCGLDSPKPAVDLEQQALVDALIRLFLGSSPQATALPPNSRVLPAGPGLRARILGLLCKSKAAADSFPATLQVSRRASIAAAACLQQQCVLLAKLISQRLGQPPWLHAYIPGLLTTSIVSHL